MSVSFREVRNTRIPFVLLPYIACRYVPVLYPFAPIDYTHVQVIPIATSITIFCPHSWTQARLVPFSTSKGRFIKVFLHLQTFDYRLVNQGITEQSIVIKFLVRRIQPVYSTVSLLPKFVRVRQRIENHCIRRNAIPSFSPRHVLHKVDPTIPFRNWIMFMPIPFRH